VLYGRLLIVCNLLIIIFFLISTYNWRRALLLNDLCLLERKIWH